MVGFAGLVDVVLVCDGRPGPLCGMDMRRDLWRVSVVRPAGPVPAAVLHGSAYGIAVPTRISGIYRRSPLMLKP